MLLSKIRDFYRLSEELVWSRFFQSNPGDSWIFLWVTPLALCVLLACASVIPAFKKKSNLKNTILLSCTTFSNSQTFYSTDHGHKPVAPMDWCCLSCLEHADNFVFTEKQICKGLKGVNWCLKMGDGRSYMEWEQKLITAIKVLPNW